MLLDDVDSEIDDHDEIFAPAWDRFYSELQSIQEDVVLMQYTGLKDRNGVEIYESDLIQVYGNKNGALTVEFKNAYIGGWVLTHKSSDGDLSLGARRQDEIEVIGNVHQGIHLLKGNP